MLNCPGCGANLRFDIDSQKLLCPYCSNMVEPEELDLMEAKLENSFETMVYTCSQCGGELHGDENEAAVFCPYCGNSTVLEGRLTKMGRPKFIVPFRVKKEDCIKSYKRLLKRSPYAPDELRKKGVTDSFRGIYMPHWYYTAVQNSTVDLRGYISHTSFDTEERAFHDCKFDMDARYEGIVYDASELFDDEVSVAIEPYNLEEKKEFAPGYMSGFYADTSDVKATTYLDNAKCFADEESYRKFVKDKNVKKYNITDVNTKQTVKLNLHTRVESSDIALLPVWFMSYKYGDRMTYAGINGQTGKAVGLIPASPLKYILYSLLCSLPLFFLVNLISFPRPEMAVLIANVLAMFVYLVFDKELALAVFHEKMGRIQEYEFGAPVTMQTTAIHKVCQYLLMAGVVIGEGLYVYLANIRGIYNPFYILVANIGISVLMWLLSWKSIRKTFQEFPFKKRFYFLGIPLCSLGIVIVQIVNPVHDIYFYLACVAQIVACCMAFVDLIHYHNILATRSMPQFDRTGGDDYVA